MNKQVISFIVILSIAIFFRFWQLGRIPAGVTNDEAGGLFNTYSVAMTGHSIDGKFLPLSFNLDNSAPPVFIYLTVPFVWLFGVSVYAMRLPFALLSVGSVFLLYLVTDKLFHNRIISLCAAFALAVSPWHIHMNRGAYDGPVTFFFLLSLYVFLSNVSSGSILRAIPWILISFYSQHPVKIFWIAFIPLLLAIYRKTLRTRKKEVFLFIVSFIAIGISFWFVLRYQGVTRQKVLLVPDMAKLSQEVIRKRTLSTAPQLLRSIYSNKLTVYGREVLSKYMQEFSPQFLFVSGEGGIYGTYYHGVLYLLDLPLLILGFFYIARMKDSKTRNLIIGSVFLAPLTSSFTIDVSYAMRGIYLLLFLMMVVGCGFYQLITWSDPQKRHITMFVKYLFFGLYIFSIIGYFYLYFFRYSIFGAELWFASSKDVSLSINAVRRQYDRVWVANAGSMFLFQYGLYTKSDVSSVARAWNGPWPKRIDNVYLLEECLKLQGNVFIPERDLPLSTLYITRESCHPNATPSATIQDRGEPLQIRWKFYERKK